MKQLLQSLRNGQFTVGEYPIPARPAGFVLVRTAASLISAGTERATVQAAQASLLGKARQRPDKVQQVLDSIKKEGLFATLNKVREKLDQPKALGYSSAGVVLEVDPGETRLRVGDRVACGGGEYATHSEVVIVPRNLVVPIPPELAFEEACFATVGAIALQGVRRADAVLGDRVLVIGLGLLGQLTWQLLAAAGCRVIGSDLAPAAVERASALGLENALVAGVHDVDAACMQLTGGNGVDSVIITAAGNSREPIELAGRVCRERGKVVIVGAVPMEVPRELYYRKELDLLISRSYGPGRYDHEYEEGGVDYPYGYVRWTEGRNIEAFVERMVAGDVRVAPLITHRFGLENAREAYEIVSGERKEAHVGIVLTYSEAPSLGRSVSVNPGPVAATEDGVVRVGFIGAGSFARSYLIPALKSNPNVELTSIATARGFTAVDAARKFGFRNAASDAEAVLSDPGVNAVFIATRHDQHAALVRRAVASGKHVFVEKPLAVDSTGLAELLAAAPLPRIVQTGFNRRFSPLSRRLRDQLARTTQPVHVTYRVNAGPLPSDHWLLDSHEGGGRIIGEGCHFLDLVQFLCDSPITRVQATRLGEDASGVTTVLIELANDSTAALIYQANASPSVPKERIEAFAGGFGGIIDDWRRLDVFDGRKATTTKVSGQAKGYAEEVAAFLAAIRSGVPALPFESQVITTAATFAVLESIRSRRPVDLVL